MEVFDAVRTILAVRSYKEKPVPSDLIGRIVEAGRLTGSGMNAQPWRFVVIEDRESIRQIGALTRTVGGRALRLSIQACGQGQETTESPLGDCISRPVRPAVCVRLSVQLD